MADAERAEGAAAPTDEAEEEEEEDEGPSRTEEETGPSELAEPPPEQSTDALQEDEEAVPESEVSLAASESAPPKDASVMKELAEAEENVKRTVALIEKLRVAVAELAKKENLTEQDAVELRNKQQELMEKISELEAVTKRIQDIAGIQNVSSSVLGPPMQCREAYMDPCLALQELKSPPIPKVIICGNDSQNQIPKIIVCDPVDKNNPKRPVFQQFPGKPSSLAEVSSTRPCSDRPQSSVPPSRGYMGDSTGFMQPPTSTTGTGQQMMTPMSGMRMPMPGQPAMFGPTGGMNQPRPPGYFYPMGQPGGYQAGQFGPTVNPMMSTPMYNQNMSQGFPLSEGIMGGGTPQLDERELNKQPKGYQSVEDLQKQLGNLQDEMKKIISENSELKKQLATNVAAHAPGADKFPEKPLCKMTIGKVPICKLDIYKQMNLPLPPPGQATENTELTQNRPMCKRIMGSDQPACRLDMYREMGLPYPGLGVQGDASTHDVETMLASMEEEVRSMQKELDGVQAERRALELQKKLLQCAAPTVAQGSKLDASVPSPMNAVSTQSGQGPQLQGNASNLPLQLQLRELREQYNKLQEDYKLKVEEVSLLRVELEGAKRESIVSIEKTEEAEAKVDDLLERLRSAEAEKQKASATRDQMIELEQQLIMAKQRFREANEEAEELKAQLSDQVMQVEEYREKYLKAQETVEEQRRQLDLNEMESNRFGEQVALEIQRVKAQFQTKLEELTPLPEMLKKSQEKLKEALHLKSLAEKNVVMLTRNLDAVNDQKEKLKKQLDEINRNKMASEAEKASLKGNLTDGEKKMEETKAENAKLRAAISRLEELALKNERKFEEKVHEALQLQSQLETLREESARQVSRTKDRCDNIRRTFLGQISELERQLAAARALAKAAQKDRDDIRQKMQAQITHLNDNFEQAQMRIRNLQSHVNYLKSSLTNIIAPIDAPIAIDKLFPDDDS